jgi:hypothetical protein
MDLLSIFPDVAVKLSTVRFLALIFIALRAWLNVIPPDANVAIFP